MIVLNRRCSYSCDKYRSNFDKIRHFILQITEPLRPKNILDKWLVFNKNAICFAAFKHQKLLD